MLLLTVVWFFTILLFRPQTSANSF